jgi:hypothetical protein
MTWRAPARDDRDVAALWALSAVGLIALRPLWLAAATFLPPCPWHRLTGWPCPGCGSTRAVLGLLQGRLAAGFAFNPLTAIATTGFVACGLAAPLWLAAGGSVPVIGSRLRPGFIAAAAAILAANWAWLLVSGI